MPLLFQRLARNFSKNGYFPTDGVTIDRILSMLHPENGSIRIMDTCCGEGTALAECANHLSIFDNDCDILSAGIEFNSERAECAKSLLGHVIHSDIKDCIVAQQQFGLLWLNPPYGDRLSDQSDQGLIREKKGRDRLEKQFLTLSLPMLQYGGVLIYIIPHYALDKVLATQLAKNLSSLSVHRLAEDRFKQIVIIGYRRRQYESGDITAIVDELLNVADDRSAASELPIEPDKFYQIPVISKQSEKKGIEAKTVRLTDKQVLEVRKSHPCLWNEFEHHFNQSKSLRRRPVRDLSQWHLALMLAAGHVSGFVHSKNGTRRLLVKGSTHKEKYKSVSVVTTDNGTEETQTLTDKFVAKIFAIDATEDSPAFGEVLVIK